MLLVLVKLKEVLNVAMGKVLLKFSKTYNQSKFVCFFLFFVTSKHGIGEAPWCKPSVHSKTI